MVFFDSEGKGGEAYLPQKERYEDAMSVSALIRIAMCNKMDRLG